CQLHNSYPFTF
nr:immunoglobulin light chain junction region [Macaca mulatta]